MPLDEAERLTLNLAQAIGQQATEGWEALYRELQAENDQLTREISRLRIIERRYAAFCHLVSVANNDHELEEFDREFPTPQEDGE